MTAFGDVARRIDEARLWRRHDELAVFGGTPRGGVNRQALSSEEIDARRKLLEWGAALGLEAATDPIGNLFLRLAGRDNSLAPVLSGSHLDTQPTGGKYDGIYGVLAALEVVEAMHAAGFVPERPLDIVVWMNEEGSRFAPGMMGSEAFTKVRPLAEILSIRDEDGISVGAELARFAEEFEELPRRALTYPVAAFVEAHIEQGPELEAAGRQIGVVTGIQGKKTYRVTVRGEEAHAGTAPRRVRKDALQHAAAMAVALHRDIVDADDVVRFTIGRFTVQPNAPSVVPSEVVFSIDLRHPDPGLLDSFSRQVEALCRELAGPCTVAIENLITAAPLAFPETMQGLIRTTAARLDLSPMDLPSAAGHDARNLHYVCPTGMIFVPCEKGISHAESEAVLSTDLAAGARVLAEVLVRLTTEAGALAGG